MRRTALTILVTLAGPLTVACASEVVSPDGEPGVTLLAAAGSGCPPGFSAPTSELEVVGGESDADKNDDGLVCFVIITSGGTNVRDRLIVVDNKVPAAAVGQCPPDFAAVAVPAGGAADHNGNASVCTATKEDGSAVVVDDNYE